MDNRLKALKMAMQLEEDGRAFYLKAAERTSSKHGREMFLSLADDEERHLRLLQKQCDAVTEGQCFLRLPEIGDIDPQWDEPLFPRDPDLFSKAVSPDASDTDALLFAIQLENKSFELYRQLARETSDAAGSEMFRWLASVERGHFNILMLNYESLLNSGSWAN